MSKTNNRTTKSSKAPTRLFGEVFDIFTLKMRPISAEFIEQLGQQSVEEALKKKNDLTVLGFFADRGYGSAHIKLWSDRSEKFKQLYESRKRIISKKRESGGLLKDPDKDYLRLDSNLVRFSMPLYNSEWRDLEVQRAKDKIEDGSSEQKVIVIERFPEAK